MDLTGAISVMKLIMKCLAKAMDEVYTAEMGEDWFVTFCEEDKTYPDRQRICQFNPKRGRYPKDVTEFDFQAYIKILSFRDTYADLLFKHYPITTSSDPAMMEKERERLRALLTRLRKDFRNSSFAHITLEDVLEEEQVSAVQTLYSYDEVVQDIKTLARIFRAVTDENGRSYYDLIAEQLAKEVLDASSPTQKRYDMQVICRKEQLDISVQKLYQYCVALDMTVHIDDGRLLLVTDNYGASIRRIRERLMLEKAQKTSKKSRRRSALLAMVAVVAVVLLAGMSVFVIGKELVVNPIVGIVRSLTHAESQETSSDYESGKLPSIPNVSESLVEETVEQAINRHSGVPDEFLTIGDTWDANIQGYVYIDNPAVAELKNGRVSCCGEGQAYVVVLDSTGSCQAVWLIQVLY